MKILAIDPGTKCGWAVSPLESGVWDLTPKRHEGGGMRFVRLHSYLATIINSEAGRPDLVVYEEVRGHKGCDAAHVYGGIIGKISEMCEGYTIPYSGIPVGTIKRHATGKGNAKKGAMVEAAQARWPEIKIVDDNHADALWIWDYAQMEYGQNVK